MGWADAAPAQSAAGARGRAAAVGELAIETRPAGEQQTARPGVQHAVRATNSGAPCGCRRSRSPRGGARTSRRRRCSPCWGRGPPRPATPTAKRQGPLFARRMPARAVGVGEGAARREQGDGSRRGGGIQVCRLRSLIGEEFAALVDGTIRLAVGLCDLGEIPSCCCRSARSTTWSSPPWSCTESSRTARGTGCS